jgi:tetratricopeptide (TPR) repeat protein
MKLRRVVCLVLPMLLLAGVNGLWVKRAEAQKASCSVDQRSPSEADMALFEHRWTDAEAAYGKMLAADPNSAEAMAGLVKTALGEGKLTDALAMAQKYQAANPKSPLLLDAVGEARFRRGEVVEAAVAFNQAMQLDLCQAKTHYDMYRFFQLSGMYATAQKRLDTAHALEPENPWIKQRWHNSHAVPMTAGERLSSLKGQLEDPLLTQDQKDGIQAAIKSIETREKGDCKQVAQVEQTKLTMLPIWYEASYKPDDMYAVGLDVEFNGKNKRLEIDTGASGIVLSRAAARSAGLVPEYENRTWGIGDEGASSSFVTHVDDMKIGNMEFKNCIVEVLAKDSDLTINADGLIGPDVFRNYLVTLDIPMREVRLGPLPKRPDEVAGPQTSLDTWDADQAQVSLADRAKDRYIAPEMKDWTLVYHWGHDLIFPTSIGKSPAKLFIMDTGAARGMISPAAAREVTHVGSDHGRDIEGLSGKVNKVFFANEVNLIFANVNQLTLGMDAFNSEALSAGSGVEISGLIGFQTLRELEISIDYRDNLVKVVYDPRHGHHINAKISDAF